MSDNLGINDEVMMKMLNKNRRATIIMQRRHSIAATGIPKTQKETTKGGFTDMEGVGIA